MVPTPLPRPASKPVVLVVDDSPANAFLLVGCLRSLYEVRVANSGELALLEAHAQPQPDVILLDIMMPGMDGYEVLQRLRTDPATQRIPIVMVTAMAGESDEVHGLEAGADDYITKPFKLSIVRARVRNQLEVKAARDLLAHENERLEAEVDRRMAENLLIQDLSIRALANLAETRDPETGRHLLRTQAYVELLARHLSNHPRFKDELAGPLLNMVVKAAPLHDIGKVGIPDTVLLKEGKLTEEEYRLMQSHALLGASTIKKAMEDCMAMTQRAPEFDLPSALQFMSIAYEIALTHHERWDGTGYPYGLRGEQIPVAGRLMALADVYDVLTSRRVYKTSMPAEQAADIIIQGRGKQFDPDVVEAFLAKQADFETLASQPPEMMAASPL